jgi:undecaprenyl-diphosphatase
MTIFQSFLLGIVQGLTEFLPISSSAHLVIVPYILNWELDPQLAFIFDVLVQVATLLAVIIFLKQDIFKIGKHFFNGIIQKQPFTDPDSRLGWCILIATIPAGLAGVFLKDLVEKAFQSSSFVAIALFFNAAILTASEIVGKRTRSLDQVSFRDGLWIGISQVISIFPGISRSGSTMAGGLTRNFNRTTAAKFSFLISIPIMLAAGFYTSLELLKMQEIGEYLLIILPGFISAGVVGYLSIRWLIKFLVKRSFYGFAIYSVAVGVLVLLITGIR